MTIHKIAESDAGEANDASQIIDSDEETDEDIGHYQNYTFVWYIYKIGDIIKCVVNHLIKFALDEIKVIQDF